jgi:hypothetical protein
LEDPAYAKVMTHYIQTGVSTTELGQCWSMDPKKAQRIITTHTAGRLLSINKIDLMDPQNVLAKGFFAWYNEGLYDHTEIHELVAKFLGNQDKA